MNATDLEQLSANPVPAAPQLAGRFPLEPNPHPASEADYRRIMDSLSFGRNFPTTWRWRFGVTDRAGANTL